MEIDFEYLVDRPDEIPNIMSWWRTVWAENMGPDFDAYERKFRSTLSKDELPIVVIGVIENEVVATAALKEHEMEEVYPDHHYWMGSVFVRSEYRGIGIATLISERIIELARQRQLPHLYLQTVDLSGGLYAALGWEPADRLVHRGADVLLMKRVIC